MKKPEQYENWLTLLEAAALYGLTENAISYYRRNGKVDAVQVYVERKSVAGNPERRKLWLINPISLRGVFLGKRVVSRQ